MRGPACQLAFIAIAGSLSLLSFPCHADQTLLSADRIGSIDAVALTDQEMGDSRGTGFVTALTQGLLAALSKAANAAASAQGTETGAAVTGFLPALLAVLPPGNTVSAQIDDQPTVTMNGLGPQSLGCGGGLSCGPNISMSLSSSLGSASAQTSMGGATLH
ncbi:hypothetical protein FRZ61_49480 [Hypericibacter adhaerens]|jgi:hypothetical protein|uniref:Uncharacterized protein n=2 Tax=Hypericibacter adhaerens TaxID=2602016 RepID=A0A5J6N698_9PROT|nr:hypothetical protein FRZ61_49480 [Hypericibacter adhaerens]